MKVWIREVAGWEAMIGEILLEYITIKKNIQLDLKTSVRIGKDDKGYFECQARWINVALEKFRTNPY